MKNTCQVDLREKIRKLRINYDPTSSSYQNGFADAITSVLVLPELQTTIEKAEKYDKLAKYVAKSCEMVFDETGEVEGCEGLVLKEKYDNQFKNFVVVEEIHKTPEERELSAMEGDHNPYVKIYRPLNEEEKEEVLDQSIKAIKSVIDGWTLKLCFKEEVKK